MFHHCPPLFLSQQFGLMKTYKLLRDVLPVLCSICLSSLQRFHDWHKPAWNLKWASSWTLLLKGFPSGLRSAQLTEEHEICLQTQLVTFHQLKIRFTCQAQFKSTKIDCGSPAKQLSGSVFPFCSFFFFFFLVYTAPSRCLGSWKSSGRQKGGTVQYNCNICPWEGLMTHWEAAPVILTTPQCGFKHACERKNIQFLSRSANKNEMFLCYCLFGSIHSHAVNSLGNQPVV